MSMAQRPEPVPTVANSPTPKSTSESPRPNATPTKPQPPATQPVTSSNPAHCRPRVLCSTRASRHLTAQNGDSPSHCIRPCDALAHGHLLPGSAHHRRRDRDLSPTVLLGRNRQCEHASLVHHPHPVVT